MLKRSFTDLSTKWSIVLKSIMTRSHTFLISPQILVFGFVHNFAIFSQYFFEMFLIFWKLKWNYFNYDMLITFCFGVFSSLSQQKSPTAEIFGKYFLQTIVPRKYMRKISTVGLFCCHKFEETPKQKLIDMLYSWVPN